MSPCSVFFAADERVYEHTMLRLSVLPLTGVWAISSCRLSQTELHVFIPSSRDACPGFSGAGIAWLWTDRTLQGFPPPAQPTNSVSSLGRILVPAIKVMTFPISSQLHDGGWK